jgi:plastocyanin
VELIGSRITLLVVIATFLLVACEGSSDPSGNVSAGPARGEAVDVTIEDAAFAPRTLELPAGAEVTVQVRNNDGTTHDFAIESMNLNTGTIDPDGVASATFTVPNRGVKFVCTYHDGMTGRIQAR